MCIGGGQGIALAVELM